MSETFCNIIWTTVITLNSFVLIDKKDDGFNSGLQLYDVTFLRWIMMFLTAQTIWCIDVFNTLDLEWECFCEVILYIPEMYLLFETGIVVHFLVFLQSLNLESDSYNEM